MNKNAIQALIDTVEATGGLIEFENGDLAPCADRDWLDLADAYLLAKEELGQVPMIRKDDDE